MFSNYEHLLLHPNDGSHWVTYNKTFKWRKKFVYYGFPKNFSFDYTTEKSENIQFLSLNLKKWVVILLLQLLKHIKNP